MVIGSKGSLVILLRNPYQENAIKDTLRWGDNQSYKAALFIDDQSVLTRGLRAANLKPKVSPSWSAEFPCGYDVKGLNMTRGRCVSPYRSNKNDTDLPASRLTSLRSL